jgi:DMSO/TMAO reductase YedYZ molybdopterin-dependent catalytic subunit/thiosulfate reductase cytochrome b subunit
MPDENHPGEGKTTTDDNESLQSEFVQEKLVESKTARPRMRLREVHIRLGHRFFSVWLILSVILGLGVVLVVAAKLYVNTNVGQGFLAQFPCIPLAPPVPAGMPAFVRWTHVLSFFLLVVIVRSGLQILADHPRLYTKVHCTPGTEWLRFRGPVPSDRIWTAKEDAITLSPLVGLPGGRHTIGVARHWHFVFDILFVINGIVYAVFLFSTPWLHRLVPSDLSIFPAAASCAVTYLSLHLPSGVSGFFRYDALQQLTYFAVIFILAPLAILTGLAMSPALDNRFRWFARLFGNRQIARSIHFLVMVGFVLFFIGHMALIALTGFTANLNDITLGNNNTNLDGVVIWLVVIALVIAFNIWAIRFSWRHTRVLQRIANVVVGRPMDLVFDNFAPRVEYKRDDISIYFWPNHSRLPDSPEWCALRDDDFRSYRLKVYGLVENPVELSLPQITELAKKSQITLHHCIQGWSGIAEWSGLPFRDLIDLVRPMPEAEWVMFYSFAKGGEGSDPYYDSHSIKDLLHPQSLLAYEMNGERLPILHGRPLRLRVENQLGFKQVKWISEIEFVHHFNERYAGQGGYSEDHEFFGYRDEI